MDPFTTAVTFVLQWEGGLSTDDTDPGGLTNFGISQRSYPDLNIRALTKDGASSIYFRDFWVRCSCPQLPPSLAILVMDCAVNQGPNQAIRLLQNALKVPADGIVGPITLQAATQAGKTIASEFAARRAYLYGVNPLFSRDGLDWSRRLCACLELALSM
jgi:lysozyme family protein